MTTSIAITKGQGLTQGLKAYLEKLKSEGKIEGEINISKSQWDATIHDLQQINDVRLQSNDANGSIFTGGNGTDWSKNMIVQEGTVTFSEAEFNTLLKDMGVNLTSATETPTNTEAEPTAAAGTDGAPQVEVASEEETPAAVTETTVENTPVVETTQAETPATIVEKPATAAGEPSFDAWTINIGKTVYTDSQKGQIDFSKFEDYDFIDKDTRAELKKTNEGKVTKEPYLKGLTSTVQEIFNVADTTPDGILTYDEYAAHELSSTLKTYHDMDVNLIKDEIKASTQNAFDLLNRNKKGKSKDGIDINEYMLGIAYMDQDKEGKIDGKIQARGYVNDSIAFGDPSKKSAIGKVFDKLSNLLFGE